MNPPCLIENMPAAQYHADPCPTPSLSASIATTLLNESPFHAWLAHPKFGGVGKEPTPAMLRGSLVHGLLLDDGPVVEVIEADNYRTKAAQEKRDAALAQGLVPVLTREYADAMEVVHDLYSALKEAHIEFRGHREAVAIWEEETDLGPVLCRGRMDHVHVGYAVAHDLKTGDANPKTAQKKIVEHGLDVQYAAYTSALRKLNPEMAGREDFVWLLVEELPPGCPKRVILTVARPSGATREHGRARWERACRHWAQCLKTNHWPAYAEGAVHLDVPTWAVKDELGAE